MCEPNKKQKNKQTYYTVRTTHTKKKQTKTNNTTTRHELFQNIGIIANTTTKIFSLFSPTLVAIAATICSLLIKIFPLSFTLVAIVGIIANIIIIFLPLSLSRAG